MAKISTNNCSVCNILFTYYQSKQKGECCSISCSTKLKWRKNIFIPNIGDKNGMWKGDDVGYQPLHAWVRRQLGNPQHCENCDTTTAKKFEWANLSGQYKRDITDWARLCTSCHRVYDMNDSWKQNLSLNGKKGAQVRWAV